MAGPASTGRIESESAVVGGDDFIRRAARDVAVFGFRLGGESLGVAKLDGDDGLEQMGCCSGLADVAGEGEQVKVCVDETKPVLG